MIKMNLLPFSVLFILSICFISPCRVFAEDHNVAKSKFLELRIKWEEEKEDYKLSSRTSDYWEGTAGKKIIAMGKHALPFIMDEIRQGNFFFNVPAEKITKISFRSNDKGESEQEIALKWVEWWEKNQDNPEWNVYLNPKSK